MKKILVILSLVLTIPTWAVTTIEFNQDDEAKCYEEVRLINCLDKEGEQIISCVNKNISKLSPACQSLHKANNSK